MENLSLIQHELNKKLDENKKASTKIYEENEIVRKYLKLQEEQNKLTMELANISREINIQKWSSCNHIWVITKHDYDFTEGRSYNYCSCIKCGLSYEVFLDYEKMGKDALNDSARKEMFDYLFTHNTSQYKGLSSNYCCNLEEAQAIYQKIKAKNPNITDEIMLQLWERELDKKFSRTRKRK